MSVLEDCQDCPAATLPNCSFPLVVPSFATGIHPSRYYAGDETVQKVWFTLEDILGQPSLFEPSFGLPRINSTTGDLSVCLKAFQHGNVSFKVKMRDDGGTSNGGLDSYTPLTIMLSVLSVNNRPTFDVARFVNVWQRSGEFRIPNFITNPSLGDYDDEDTLWPGLQSVTMTLVPQNPTLFVNNMISLNAATNTLSFTLANDVRGDVNVSITMKDADGVQRGGHDTSLPRIFTLIVVDSYVVYNIRYVHYGIFRVCICMCMSVHVLV
jgi:hypothetical protein